jgi:poly-gamma-glutamate capsule biosynthesis protein CapA/YwtB (metallophosphatase superfamily)
MSDAWGSTRRSAADIDLLFTGDLVLDVEQPDHWLSGIAPALRAADLAIGHLEVPHTRRGHELAGDVPAPGAPPEHLDALHRAGISAVTLAGNHIADCGEEGIVDTIARLDILGIAWCGAGATLSQARQPAVLECRGRRIAVLSYNCVGPEQAWAGAQHSGCSYLPLRTADGAPVAPAADLRDIAAEAYDMLREDIAAARSRAGLVVVALHKGIVHTPARLAPYERPLAEAALRAGADLVVGHHAHILRGIEFAHDRPVFHGLGNGCVVTRALSPAQDHPQRAAWARRRRELFGFEPDPRYEFAPFHPEAVHAALARVLWRADGSLVAGITPVHVEPPGRPLLVTDERADAVVDYFARIGRDAGLPQLAFHRASRELWTCEPADRV